MVARDGETVGGGQSSRVHRAYILIGGAIDRPGEGGAQEADILYPRPPAMLGQLRVMNGEDDRFADPPPGRTHRASSRSTFRRFFMTLRASVI